jgi:hypothetical protein
VGQEDIFTGITNVTCTMGVHRLGDKCGSGMRLKCPACYEVAFKDEVTTFGGKDGNQPLCSDCELEMVPLCKNDHKCTCIETVHQGMLYCPDCGHPVCPGCGAHNVEVVSRVTGYLSSVGGWNAAKQQELKDRHRVNVGVSLMFPSGSVNADRFYKYL